MSQSASADTEAWHLSRLSSHTVSEHWKPVILYRNNRPIGIGTSFTNRSGAERIVTVAHIFEQTFGRAEWTYRRLRPVSTYRFPIESAGLIPGIEMYDVAICVPGSNNLPRIQGFSSHSIGKEFGGEAILTPMRNGPRLTSLITAQTVQCVATVAYRGCTYLLTPLASIPGESGTGFVDESGSAIHVLKGEFVIPLQERERLPFGTSELALMCRLATT